MPERIRKTEAYKIMRTPKPGEQKPEWKYRVGTDGKLEKYLLPVEESSVEEQGEDGE